MPTPVLREDEVIVPVVEGHDQAALAYGYQERPIVVRRCTIKGNRSDWGGKMSKGFDALFEDCTFENGLERAYDQVRGGNITFRNCTFVNTVRNRTKSKWALQKQCDAGIKAGVFDITFDNCKINDILIGDYSIYDQVDRPKSRRIKLINCTNPNGGPVIVRVRYGVSVITDNTPISQLVWPSFITGIYWWYNRKFGDRRVVAPEELALAPEEQVP